VPFYSGREAGRGLGMGLAIADRIARDHGGHLTICHARPTTLRVLLPAA
jgi:C4-dicarboxylate-specific signal transduction histidine kinase